LPIWGQPEARPEHPSEYCSKSWEQHSQDVNLIAGPIGHDLTFSKGFLGSLFTLGKVIFLDSTDDKEICEAIEREKVTSIIWVPTLAQRMLQYKDLDAYDLSSLKKMHSAGGASHPDLVRDVTERLNMKFYNGYGGTEGMTTITRTTDDLETICTTVGRPTCPYDTYKVIDMHMITSFSSWDMFGLKKSTFSNEYFAVYNVVDI